jgi:hypothetical protein
MEQEASELPRSTTWLTEGICLAIASAGAYLFAYVYERGYCSIFGVPIDLIKPDIGSILRIGILPIAAVWPLVLFIETATKYRFLLALIAPVIIATTFLVWGYWEHWNIIKGLIISIALLVFSLAMDLILLRNRSIVLAVHKRWGTGPLSLLFLLVFGIFGYERLGEVSALHQREFLVLSDNTNAIVLRVYNDTAICAVLDTPNKQPSGKYLLLKFDSGTNQLELRKIGPFSPMVK